MSSLPSVGSKENIQGLLQKSASKEDLQIHAQMGKVHNTTQSLLVQSRPYSVPCEAASICCGFCVIGCLLSYDRYCNGGTQKVSNVVSNMFSYCFPTRNRGSSE
jgi:hypothetical protein